LYKKGIKDIKFISNPIQQLNQLLEEIVIIVPKIIKKINQMFKIYKWNMNSLALLAYKY